MIYLGIDLGGTNIAAGLVDEEGKIIIKDSVPTLAARENDAILADIAALCKRLISRAGITTESVEAVGIGCPGLVDHENGTLLYAHNLGMKDINICSYLSRALDRRVIIENDADAAALGEYTVNGNGAKSFVFITLGTGVGGGFVTNGKIERGFNGVSPEPGHITIVSGGVECTCGKRGCWEAYASVTALIRQTRNAMDAYPESLMNAIAMKQGKVSGRTAFLAAKDGDAAGLEVVENYRRYIADGLVSIINSRQPEIALIGGGISKEGSYLLDGIVDYIRKYEFNRTRERTRIGIATLFNDAGIIGAALAAAN